MKEYQERGTSFVVIIAKKPKKVILDLNIYIYIYKCI